MRRNGVNVVVFDFDRVVSVGEGILADERTCATDEIDAWIRLLNETKEYGGIDKETIVKTLVGGESRFQDLRRVFSVVSRTVDRVMVVTNNKCREVVAGIIRTIEGNDVSNFGVRSMVGSRGVRVRKCDFLNRMKLVDNFGKISKILFFDDSVENFDGCADSDVIRVAVTASRNIDAIKSKDSQIREINKIFTEKVDAPYKKLAIKTIGDMSLTTFDGESGLMMRMRSRTSREHSSEAWNLYVDETEIREENASWCTIA